ncbi:MAG: spermidine/putrescine ABC transporter substrate-binding protein [Spirochaetaceae bacterium]|nr:spermidine/putrescine ABC transporter substrate-binding protein [Spirochaetaceae bacterium]
MKKFWIPLSIALSVLVLGSCGGGSKKELNLLTWQDYVPAETVERFKEETGITINYSYFDTNEEMLTKLEAEGGDYDVVICSEYIIGIGIEKGVFRKIDVGGIKNYGNINPEYQGKKYDPLNEYSIPYCVFIAGILYNPAKTNLTFDSFADLADPSLRNSVVIVDAPQSIIGEALTALGYSYNETDPVKIEAASEFLQRLRPNILAFNTTAPQDFVVNGEAIAAYSPSSNCIYGKMADDTLKIAYPRNSANVYGIDSFLIVKNAPNPENAHIFLDFMLNPEIAAITVREQNVEAANRYVDDYTRDMVDAGLVAKMPEEALRRDQHPEAMPAEVQALYDRIWTRFKQ